VAIPPGGWRHDSGPLSLVVLPCLMAMVLRALCCRLGIATGMNLAQVCRRLLPGAWSLPPVMGALRAPVRLQTMGWGCAAGFVLIHGSLPVTSPGPTHR
jgi:hypothetical protein